ncbi:MAG TPA: TIR domain-containing protein [Bryobacteraceae bacterium]|nr:TIR domain-containing protein [Bryobacteraceae bacterium]
MEAKTYDVFLSYNRKDLTLVQNLRQKLASANLKPFFDLRDLLPGGAWPEELQQALRASSTCAVCIGPAGLGPWQHEEIQNALMRRIQVGDLHVIPVFLPGCGESPSSGVDSLDRLTRVHFRSECDDTAFDALVAGIRTRLPGDPSKALRPGRTSWEHYDWLFRIDEFQLAYLPLLNEPRTEVVERAIGSFSCGADDQEFALSADFDEIALQKNYEDRKSCRLNAYSKRDAHGRMTFRFGRTSYEAYLKSGEHLDRPDPRKPSKTYRDRFGRLVIDGAMNLRPFPLTNICGCGLFIRTSDGRVVASKHSVHSHVYPGRTTFAASGIMRWCLNPDPFSQIVRTSWEELKHQVSTPDLSLLTFGADARKLYFQFGFVEQYPHEFVRLLEHCRADVELRAIHLHPDAIAGDLVENCWEPAAEACLLTLCALECNNNWDPVIEALGERRHEWGLRDMRDEWDYRAWQPGPIPDMSVRYPADKLQSGSQQYVAEVMEFVRSIGGGPWETAVEVGAGTGRITSALVDVVGRLTVVDLCPRMLERNRSREAERRAAVHEYKLGFGQEVLPSRHFNLAVCCLVLIHNVSEEDFLALVSAMCDAADTVVVCEDITQRRPTSPRTKLRSDQEIVAAFERYGFDVVQTRSFSLFEDDLWLAQFTRSTRLPRPCR